MQLWNWLKSLLSSRVRNRVTERDIRDWLTRHGFAGDSATLVEVELHAIKRPGWQQIFRFSGSAIDAGEKRVALFGIVEDDERYRKTEITLYENARDRAVALRRVSEGYSLRRQDR